MMSKMRAGRSKGFTLIEIMLVVVIIGILAAVIGPKLVGKSKQARVSATKSSIKGVETALALFEVHVSRFPTTDEGLGALITRPSDVSEDVWEGPYLKEKNIPKDAFDNEFSYQSPGENDEDYVITSKGPDGQENNADDITSVVKED